MSDRPRSPRPGKASSQASPASLGLVRVGDDFAREFPDGDRASTEGYASLVRVGNALLLEIGREARHFEAAFPALEFAYLPASAGEDQLVLLSREQLVAGLGRPKPSRARRSR